MKSFFEFSEELHRILLKADREKNLYGPLTLDLEDLKERILAAKSCLENNLSLDLLLEETQDAAFIYFLQTPTSQIRRPIFEENEDFCAIFSNFSDLVCVGPVLPGRTNSKEFFVKVSECLEAQGFYTVRDKAVFDQKYDGKMKGFIANNASWGDRFFNYL
jgi:hypothetical protein